MMAGEEEDVQRRHGARTFQEALTRANITWGGAERTAMDRARNRQYAQCPMCRLAREELRL